MINCIEGLTQLKGKDYELLAEYGCITHVLYDALKKRIGEKEATEMISDAFKSRLTFDDEKNSVSDAVPDNRIGQLPDELLHELNRMCI